MFNLSHTVSYCKSWYKNYTQNSDSTGLFYDFHKILQADGFETEDLNQVNKIILKELSKVHYIDPAELIQLIRPQTCYQLGFIVQESPDLIKSVVRKSGGVITNYCLDKAVSYYLIKVIKDLPPRLYKTQVLLPQVLPLSQF